MNLNVANPDCGYCGCYVTHAAWEDDVHAMPLVNTKGTTPCVAFVVLD